LQELHLDKILDSIFVLRIARLRSHCFVTAKLYRNFPNSPTLHHNMAFNQLASSPRLSTLWIASNNFPILEPDEPDLSDPLNASQRSVLLEVFSKIRNVTFKVYAGSKWPSARLIRMFPKLRRLAIEALADEDRTGEGLVQLRHGLSLVPTVRELEVRTSDGIDLSRLYSTNLPLPPPHLTSLSISALKVHSSALDFAQNVSNTLEKLQIEFTTDRGDVDTSDFRFQDHHSLVKLRSLSRLGYRVLVEPIFLSSCSRHLPSLGLLHLALDFCDARVADDISSGIAEIGHHGTKFPFLKVFEVVDRKWLIDGGSAERFVRIVAGGGVVAKIDQKHAPFDAMVLWTEEDNEPIGDEEEGVLNVLAFLQDRAGKASLSNSMAEWHRLATLLRPAELERVAMMA